MLLGRLAAVQVLGPPELARRAVSQRERPGWRAGTTMLEHPRRGTIEDRRGRPLALSWYAYDLVVDPVILRRHVLADLSGDRDLELVSSLPSLLEEADVRPVPAARSPRGLHRLLFTATREVAGGRRREVRYRVLSQACDPQSAARLGELLDRLGVPGFSFVPELRRTYPYGAATSQVLGVLGQTATDPGPPRGRGGVEESWDTELTGRCGRLRAEQDALGRELLDDPVWERRPRPGADLRLTLDAEIQRIALEELQAAAPEHDVLDASAVVLAVEDGAVLAAVSCPSVDPRNPDADFSRLSLRALQRVYTPGSSMKPLFISWALHRKAISRKERFDCGGAAGWRHLGSRTVKEFSRNPEPLDARGVLMRSSNVGAVRIAFERLGLPGMFDALEAFRIAERPAIRFPALARGRHTTRSEARPGYTGPAFPQGYEMVLSPLGVARMFLVLARGGTFVEPRLVEELRQGHRRWRLQPGSALRVLDTRTVAYVLNAMREAVENPRGTCRKARSDRWTLAGKTGTGEVDTAGALDKELYNAWFSGIAPAGDPGIVVVVHHQVRRRGPSDPYTGGSVSGPPARRIIERTLAYLGVPEDRRPREGGR